MSAPFRYTTLIGAVALGYLFFDEIPNALTMIGCSIILLASMCAIGLERRAVAAVKLATLERIGL